MTAPKSAAVLAGVFLTSLAGLCLFAWHDRNQLAALESFSETSAVGDAVYYRLPTPLPEPPIPVAMLRGRALVPVSYTKLEWRDTKMRAVARDPVTRLTIYATREPLPPSAGEPRDSELFFVKTAANEYLRLRAN